MTTISHLSQPLLAQILSRVPITCLGAVRSTCKGWNALSKQNILCKAESRDQFLGFMMKKFKVCSMRFDLRDEFVDPSLSIKELGYLVNQVEISKVFQCDGLLLCVTRDNTRLVVWNPYLGQTRWIEPSNAFHRLDSYAIGYDNNRQHKILRFVDADLGVGNHVFGYEIYDFFSNAWRVLDITPNWDIESYQRGATLKGNTYFFAKEKLPMEPAEIPEPEDYLLCFDFTTESFGQFLPLPFQQYCYDAGALSSLRDEKLAALYSTMDRPEVEIWVTTKIEPNAVSWIPFLKVDMEPLTGFGFQFCYYGGSFFIDEEKKVAVVIHLDIHLDESEMSTCYDDTAYIIGENGYLKRVILDESPNFRDHKDCCPLVCSCSYVPSLVQINQIAGGKKEREEDEANQRAAQIRRLTIN